MGDALDIRQIVAIDALARTRSFKTAAEALNTTQPTLSRVIASAETALGQQLFQRGWSGAETTAAGDIAARSAAIWGAALAEAEARLFKGRQGVPPLRLNLKAVHLLTVEAVTRHGSVTQAARALGRSQPDLSRTMADLTGRFGLELFSRTGTGMMPLPAARELTALCGTFRWITDGLRERLRNLEGEVVGRVAVGMLPFSGQDLISAAFARLTNLHPNVRLSCVPGSYNTLVEALRRREIDRIVGILRGEACSEGLEEQPLTKERFVVMARADHPLQTGGDDPEKLARTRWVVAPHGTPVRTHFEAVFSALNLTPPTQTCEMLSFGAAEQMLVESDGAAMLTYSARKLATLRPELREVSTGFPEVTTSVGLTMLRGLPADQALGAFDRILTELAREA